jgi:hypothetical protein
MKITGKLSEGINHFPKQSVSRMQPDFLGERSYKKTARAGIGFVKICHDNVSKSAYYCGPKSTERFYTFVGSVRRNSAMSLSNNNLS